MFDFFFCVVVINKNNIWFFCWGFESILERLDWVCRGDVKDCVGDE